jgi:hypothetical protein
VAIAAIAQSDRDGSSEEIVAPLLGRDLVTVTVWCVTNDSRPPDSQLSYLEKQVFESFFQLRPPTYRYRSSSDFQYIHHLSSFKPPNNFEKVFKKTEKVHEPHFSSNFPSSAWFFHGTEFQFRSAKLTFFLKSAIRLLLLLPPPSAFKNASRSKFAHRIQIY